MDSSSFLNKTLGVIDTQDVNVDELILSAHRIGVHVNIYTDHNGDAYNYADHVTVERLSNRVALKKFAAQCQWVIYVNGTTINASLINYLKQFTQVPQGSDELDLINDHSILHVFLDSLNINSLPYETVFSTADVKQALTKMNFPVIIRPVQNNYLKDQSVLITNPSQLSNLDQLFKGEAYLLESLPNDSRYFNLTAIKLKDGSLQDLPVVENHYHGQSFDYANLSSKLPLRITDQFREITEMILNHLHYVGALSISFILTQSHQIYVNGIGLPFSFENHVFDLTSDNVSQMILKATMGLSTATANHLQRVWIVKPVDIQNVNNAQQLWANNNLADFNLRPLTNSDQDDGYALYSAKTLDDVKKKLRTTQL